MGAMLREKDWGKTKFGSMGNWPPSLVSMVSLLINSASPMALWYGKEHLVIYNDAYIPDCREQTPDMLWGIGGQILGRDVVRNGAYFHWRYEW